MVVPSEGVGLRGEWVVPFSSGSAFAISNDREKDTRTALAVAFGDELKFSR